MLDKIVQIKNIGCFRNYSANGDVTFRKVTLIYAENGRGKTTLCAILRSLMSGDADFIHERKSLASTETESVHLRIKETNHQFTNNAWTMMYPDLVIFDSEFVNNNVYSGDYVEHEHKKNLYRVIVGTQGVQLAHQIEKLDSQIRTVNTNLRNKKETLLPTLPLGVELNDYLQWDPIPDIEAQIQQKTDELSSRQRATSMSGEIKAKGLFSKVHLPSLPSDFSTVLMKQLTDITYDAEIKVRQQIAYHQMGHTGESWLSNGLGYVKDDKCPFCGQDVSSNDLIKAYRSQFNDDYRNLKQEVAQLSQRINDVIDETALSSIQQVITNNQTLAEFWKQFVAIELPDISFSDIQQNYAMLREHCLVLARKKQNNPIEPVALDAKYSLSLENIEVLRQVIDTYNKYIETCNARIHEQKTTTQKGSDITTTLKKELVLLEAKKKRFEPEVIQLCKAYQEVQILKIQLEGMKESTRKQLDQYCQNILSDYEQSINEYLDQFNAGFRITNTRHLYTGGTPSSQYQIQINNIAVDLGDSRTNPGRPCFKTTLSSGDRSALALAFFLAVLKQDVDINRKVIVFDDPFTSLDRFRRTCTQQLIQRLSNLAEQVIVLSHDPLFLKLIFDEYPSANNNIKTLQMNKAGNTTVIGEWDIQAEVQNSYMKDFSTLLGFYRDRDGDLRAVARTIRPFLEGMLRSHFPGHFQPNEWLGDFIGKIRNAEANDGLQHAQADLEELDAINGFSKKYHHDQNVNAESEPINEDELHGYVKRTLKLVGGN